MIYKVGMLCKHFKGNDLFEKNIYRIVSLGNRGVDLSSDITYTGDNDVNKAENLVVYANIFQNDKLFAREYDDISSTLSLEKQKLYSQLLKVQPLNDEEISFVSSDSFKEKKTKFVEEKYKTMIKK